MKDRIVPNLPLPTPVTNEEIAAKQRFPHGWAATRRTDCESFTVIAIGDVDAVHDYIAFLYA